MRGNSIAERASLTKCFRTIPAILDIRPLLLILSLISFIYFLWGIGIGIRYFDEGNFVYGAARILRGEIPYRDFFVIYFPAQFYVLAFLFKVAGESLLLERIYGILVYLIIVASTFCLVKKLAGQRLASLAWLLSTLWFAGYGFLYFSTPAPPSIMFSLLGSFFLADYIYKKRKRDVFAAGILSGVSALFRQDIGAYTFMSAIIVILAFVYTNLFETEEKKISKLLGGFRIGALYCIGTICVILPVAAFFLFTAPTRELVYDLILFPLVVQPQFNSRPYPMPAPNPLYLIQARQSIISYVTECIRRVPFYFPIAVFVIALLAIAARLVNKKTRFSPEIWVSIFFLLLGVTCFNLARGRSDLAHLYPMAIPSMVLLPSLFSNNVWEFPGKLKSIARFLLFFLLFSMLTSLGYYCFKAIPPPSASVSRLALSRAHGIYLSPNEASSFQQAVKFIQERVPGEQEIFVGNIRHDQTDGNNIMFYFLAERHCATKYYSVSALTTTSQVQEKIVDDLTRRNVKYIVVWIFQKRTTLGNGEPSGAKILDEFIRDHYTPIRKFGDYVILQKRV